MIRIMKVAAVLAALSPLPALGGEGAPAQGSSRDPFSQTYTGKEEVAQKQEEARPCDRWCSCGRHEQGTKAQPKDARAPTFTDAG